MTEKLKLQIAVLVKNTITIVVFAILAIFFKKWWMIFMAILFNTSIVEKGK